MVVVVVVVVGPVVAAEKRLIVFATAEAAQNVQVSEPAAEEVGDAVFAVDGAGAATGQDHTARRVEMVLPRHRHIEGVGGDDFKRG